MRTDLLDSYLRDTAPSVTSWFDHAKLVIVDLSDPFLDGASAATLFEIILGVFVEWRSHSRRSRKIIVLDEAHKYLSNSDNARLTKTLCSLIRQQRHLGVRIIVSTQEPTVVPATILDLTSYIICHRFSSPSWCSHLKQHVSLDIAHTQQAPWIEEVMQLHAGEALVFSPNAVAVRTGSSSDAADEVARLGTGYLKILTRPRITLDGGFSIMAVDPDHPDVLPDATGQPFPSPPGTSFGAPSPGSSLSMRKISSFTPSPPPTTYARTPSPTWKAPPLATPAPTIHSHTPSSMLKPSPAPIPTLKQSPIASTNGTQPHSSSTPVNGSSQSTNCPYHGGKFAPAPAQQRAVAPNPVRSATGKYRELIEILELYAKEGIRNPRRGLVGTRLNNMHPRLFRNNKFATYLEAAANGGYVKIGSNNLKGDKWVSLP